MIDPRKFTQFKVLTDPFGDDLLNHAGRHLRQGKIVARRKTHDPAKALFRSGFQQTGGIHFPGRYIGQQRRKVVVKYEYVPVIRVAKATRA